MGVIRHFSRGRERNSVFVRNPFVADSDIVNVLSGNDATQEEFTALKMARLRRMPSKRCLCLHAGQPW